MKLLKCGCWQMDRKVINKAIKEYQKANPGKLNVREAKLHDVRKCLREQNEASRSHTASESVL